MRPLLLVDVDGVLLLQNSRPGMKTCPHGWYDPANGPRMRALAEVYDLVWCTGWGKLANIEIAPLFHLPQLPVISLDLGRFAAAAGDQAMSLAGLLDHQIGNCWKLPSVEYWLDDHHDRPVAWLDDMIGTTDVKRWAQRRPRTRLFHTRGDVGLTQEITEGLSAPWWKTP